MLRGVDLSNWRQNAWTRDKIYHALGKRQLQRHRRTDDGLGALVATKVWPDDEVDGGLDRDAPLPYRVGPPACKGRDELLQGSQSECWRPRARAWWRKERWRYKLKKTPR